MVAGSGQSEHSDAAANAPEVDVAKGADGYTEGIPGPITRLFVIANRGIANLIQDLILVSIYLIFLNSNNGNKYIFIQS